MIQTILKIRGIGLLHDAVGQPLQFPRVTAIYGENGRGKSTMSAILSSLSTGSPAGLIGRRTIGGSHDPEVALKIEGNFHQFMDGKWSSPFPDISVFDSSFVDGNVYSGSDKGHQRLRD